MRIDLHCHTKKIKSGDGKARNVTPTLFKEKIELADVKIVAITNHNAFDYQQYLSLKESVKFGRVLKLMSLERRSFI